MKKMRVKQMQGQQKNHQQLMAKNGGHRLGSGRACRRRKWYEVNIEEELKEKKKASNR